MNMIASGVTSSEEVLHLTGSPADEARLRQIIQESGPRIGLARSPRQKMQLAETARFMADIINGRRKIHYLEEALNTRAFQQQLGELLAIQVESIYGTYPVQNLRAATREALSTSDFPILFGDVMDRQLLGQYQEWPLTWPNIARRATVRDFRQVRRITLDGLDERWYPDYATAELQAPWENDNLVEGQYTYNVGVYQRSFAINWRMLINDDLDAFQNLAPRLARGARRTEEFFATGLYVDANGPHASFYTAGNENIVNQTNGALANNPPLTIAGLQDAFTVLMSQVDPQGEPIMIDLVELVVPPALKVIAENILNATELRVGGTGVAGGGATDQQVITMNWMRQNMRLEVNPYIPIIASSANGNTSWFLFASPGVTRPALEIGFLRGYETPGLYQKAPNVMRLGGGLEPAMGDFDTMSLTYKGMHVIGGTRMDPKMTVASNGSNA